MAANRPDDALILLGRLSNAANQENQLGLQVEVLCLEALGYDMKGNLNGALTALDWAFSLGADEGYVRTFADEGETASVNGGDCFFGYINRDRRTASISCDPLPVYKQFRRRVQK